MRLLALSLPCLLAAVIAPLAVAAPVDSGAVRREVASTLKVRKATLIAVNRAFTAFNERIEARPRVRFPIGDTEYSARIVEFVPAFSMNIQKRKVFSYSKEPENPAFRIIVEKGGVPEDTTWAFLNMPPHYARNSLLAFLIERIEFENHAPVVASKPGAPPKAAP